MWNLTDDRVRWLIDTVEEISPDIKIQLPPPADDMDRRIGIILVRNRSSDYHKILYDSITMADLDWESLVQRVPIAAQFLASL